MIKGSFRLGSVSSFVIYLHWTLLVMFAAIFGLFMFRGASVGAALVAMLLIILVFASVILHELGHAFVARNFGIGTRDITMYPIGGIARLERNPSNAKEEFWIAVAGPAVNLAIALAIGLVVKSRGLLVPAADVFALGTNMWTTLMWMNVALAAFNLIPAFPMDGGRVLRAGLASTMSYKAATNIATLVGQALAIIFFLAGMVNLNLIMMFIGVFVFAAARQEAQLNRDQY